MPLRPYEQEQMFRKGSGVRLDFMHLKWYSSVYGKTAPHRISGSILPCDCAWQSETTNIS